MFSKRWIINYVLVVLIVVFTYVGNRFDVETGYQPQQGIINLKPAEVNSIAIDTADRSLKLQREGSGWRLTSPIQWPASNINVKRLLDIVNREAESRLAANEIDLATIGLQFPRAILSLNDIQVLFGETNNIGERRYLMIGSTVFLLPDLHLPFISQGLVGFVDRRLLPRGLELIELRLPAFELTRNAENTWQLGNADGFDQDKIDQLIANWQVLEATRVDLYNSAAIPRQIIEALLANGNTHEFFVLSIDPQIIIAHPQIGLQYYFDKNLYYQLLALSKDETPG